MVMMGYDVEPVYYRIKQDKKYFVMSCEPWEHQLFTDDILTKNKNGLYTVHTGIMVTSLTIPDEDLIEETEKTAHLVGV